MPLKSCAFSVLVFLAPTVVLTLALTLFCHCSMTQPRSLYGDQLTPTCLAMHPGYLATRLEYMFDYKKTNTHK
jgi:hypothetical protein